MSLLWSERTVVYVDSEEIGGLHRAAGPRAIPQTAHLQAPSAGHGTTLLRELLGAFSARRGRVDLVLSSSLVRFLLVLPSSEIASIEARRAYVELLFERDFGLKPGSFVQRIDGRSLQRPALACAIENKVLQRLIDGCGGPERVGAVVPLFVLAFNSVRRKLGSGMLAVVEGARITIGMVAGGVWQLVASRVCARVDRDALQLMLSEYGELAGVSGATCHLFDPDGRIDQAGVAGGWKLNRFGPDGTPLVLAASGLMP